MDLPVKRGTRDDLAKRLLAAGRVDCLREDGTVVIGDFVLTLCPVSEKQREYNRQHRADFEAAEARIAAVGMAPPFGSTFAMKVGATEAVAAEVEFPHFQFSANLYFWLHAYVRWRHITLVALRAELGLARHAAFTTRRWAPNAVEMAALLENVWNHVYKGEGSKSGVHTKEEVRRHLQSLSDAGG